MNVNNQMYNLFEHMMQGYKDGNVGAVESGARCWLMFDPENPFSPESDEYEAFYKMQMCFIIWRRGDINGRINKRRMLEWALKLCALNPKQPYVFDKKADMEEKKAEEEKRKAELLAAQKQTEQPEKQSKIESLREVADNIEIHPEKKVVLSEPKKVLNVKEDEEKDKKSWLKFLHPWR